jgi:multiple antibiotic resistance protein
LVDFAISAFVTLLLVVDPVGLVPAFLSATHGMSEHDRKTIATRAPLIAAAVTGLTGTHAKRTRRCPNMPMTLPFSLSPSR